MKCVVNTPDWSYIITKNILCNLLHWFLRNKTKVLHCPNSPQLYSTLIHTDHEEDKCDKWRSYNIPCSIKIVHLCLIWCRVVRSRDVHPCYMVSRCPVSRCQSQQFWWSAMSSSAFSVAPLIRPTFCGVACNVSSCQVACSHYYAALHDEIHF